VSYWACAQLEANRERLALHCLGLRGFEVYLPRIRMRKLKTAALFPGYAFVLIELQWHAARWSPESSASCSTGFSRQRCPTR
jgi:hypothetical protein